MRLAPGFRPLDKGVKFWNSPQVGKFPVRAQPFRIPVPEVDGLTQVLEGLVRFSLNGLDAGDATMRPTGDERDSGQGEVEFLGAGVVAGAVVEIGQPRLQVDLQVGSLFQVTFEAAGEFPGGLRIPERMEDRAEEVFEFFGAESEFCRARGRSEQVAQDGDDLGVAHFAEGLAGEPAEEKVALRGGFPEGEAWLEKHLEQDVDGGTAEGGDAGELAAEEEDGALAQDEALQFRFDGGAEEGVAGEVQRIGVACRGGEALLEGGVGGCAEFHQGLDDGVTDVSGLLFEGVEEGGDGRWGGAAPEGFGRGDPDAGVGVTERGGERIDARGAELQERLDGGGAVGEERAAQILHAAADFRWIGSSGRIRGGRRRRGGEGEADENGHETQRPGSALWTARIASRRVFSILRGWRGSQSPPGGAWDRGGGAGGHDRRARPSCGSLTLLPRASYSGWTLS